MEEVVSNTVGEFIGAIAQYGSEGIIILALLIVVYIVNKFISTYEKTENTHQENYKDFKSAILENTQTTREMNTYLKLRNGTLDKQLENLTTSIDNCQKLNSKKK